MTHCIDSRIYPINKLTAVVAAMKAEGIPVELALQGTGINPQELNAPTSKMSVSQLLTAYRNALEFSRDPYFAVRLGQNVKVTTYGIYGYAMLSSPTQRALIELVLKYNRLVAATAELSFREIAGEIGVWTIEPLTNKPTEQRFNRFVVEVYLGTILALSSDILERPERIKKEIRLVYPYSPDLPAYEEFFGCPVLFGQDQNELRINTAWLDVPTRCSNELTFVTVQKMCEETLDQMELSAGVSGDLRQILLESAGRFPTVEEVCQRLGVNPRTLRRKLKAEGTSYGVLVNETRIRLAKRYLRETAMTIDEIASRIGYSDTSNFRRAFQRSTDVTPAAYRRGA